MRNGKVGKWIKGEKEKERKCERVVFSFSLSPFLYFTINMLLTIDTGNTNTVFAIFNEDALVGKWRMSSARGQTADECAIILAQFLQTKDIGYKDITAVVISNVVPQNMFMLKTLCSSYIGVEPIVVGESDIDLGIEVKLEKKSEIGADRIVNAVAAYEKFGGNVIVIDFGTATTFDVIDNEGAYIGGVIAPGINLSMKALHLATAKLPEVDVAKPEKVIGNSTIGAMQSGIYWGYVSLIEGMVSRIKKEYGADMKVLATGGLAPLFAEEVDVIDGIEHDLTIDGMRLIYMKNERKGAK